MTAVAFRTILVHVDQSPSAPTRINLAAVLARQEQAHLIGVAMTGVPRFMHADSPFNGAGAVISDYLRHASHRANAALTQFDRIMAAAGPQSCEHRFLCDDEYSGLCLESRYADLLVLGQPNPYDHQDAGFLLDLPAHVVLHSGRPVLLVPYAGAFFALGNRALIAWNGSIEAARAVTAALPLLRPASRVMVALFDIPEYTASHSDGAGAQISHYLARHGIDAEIHSSSNRSDCGNAILSLAAQNDADLLVMGAYGHSQLRQLVLGGATRTVLASMTLPVLMAH